MKYFYVLSSKLLMLTLILNFSILCIAQSPIITKWNTNINNDSSKNIEIYTIGAFNYTYQGITNPAVVGSGIGNNGVTNIVFSQPGIYKVNIVPNSTFKFNFGVDTGINVNNNKKFIEISQWGDVLWNQDQSLSFVNCKNLQITATDIPSFSNVTDMGGMFGFCTSLNTVPNMNSWNTSNVVNMQQLFYGAENFNENIGNWDTSKVENMNLLFANAKKFNQQIGGWNTSSVIYFNGTFALASVFNQNIGNWNTSNATDMGGMFNMATSFNQNIANWDTSKVNNMSGMFASTPYFNQDIGNWNTSSVTNMSGMFFKSEFNKDIGNWNTSKVTDMSHMFDNAIYFNKNIANWDTSKVTNMSWMLAAYNFNQDLGNWNTSSVTDMSFMFNFNKYFNRDIGNWDTSKVTNMDGMFESAERFNQRLGSWDIRAVQNMRYMFSGTSISCQNYSLTLKGWAEKSNTPNEIIFDGGGLRYGDLGEFYKYQLINNKDWSISGDVYDPTCSVLEAQNPIKMIWDTNINNDNSKSFTIFTVGDYNYTYKNITNSSITDSGRGADGFKTISFPEPGKYEVSIYPLNKIRLLMGGSSDNDRKKLVELTQWGNDVKYDSDLSSMFSFSDNLKITATDLPNLSNVTNLTHFFLGCKSLEKVPNISQWNITNANDLSGMFRETSNFDQDLGGLNLNSNVKLIGFFESSGISCENYAKTLKGWSLNGNTPYGRDLGAYQVKFGQLGLQYRNELINSKGWTISGDTYYPSCPENLSVENNGDTENRVIIYPNPTIDYINFTEEIINVKIFDMSGKLVQTSSTGKRLDISNLQPEIYTVIITDKHGKTKSTKIIKK